jgi:hypothetical protein
VITSLEKEGMSPKVINIFSTIDFDFTPETLNYLVERNKRHNLISELGDVK